MKVLEPSGVRQTKVMARKTVVPVPQHILSGFLSTGSKIQSLCQSMIFLENMIVMQRFCLCY
jgi:hypothetical protein